MNSRTNRRAAPYTWDDRLGVLGKNGLQAIQLLQGPASPTFRKVCGRLLVEALNRKFGVNK